MSKAFRSVRPGSTLRELKLTAHRGYQTRFSKGPPALGIEPMTKQAKAQPSGSPEPEIQGPAKIGHGMVKDRVISPLAGAETAWRRLDGLAYLKERKLIAGHQEQAGLRLQEDHEISLMQAMPRSGTGGGGHGPRDIPQAAIDADRRVRAALACLPPSMATMTSMYLLPKKEEDAQFFSFEKIGKLVEEDKRAVPYGIRMSLHLLARHYGFCT